MTSSVIRMTISVYTDSNLWLDYLKKTAAECWYASAVL